LISFSLHMYKENLYYSIKSHLLDIEKKPPAFSQH